MNRRKSLLLMACAILLTIFTTNADAQERMAADSESVAITTLTPTEVRWEPRMANAGGVITVAIPDGRVIRQEFAAGAMPTFSIFGSEGERFSDGIYTYELTLTPILSEDTRQKLAKARADGNSAAVVQGLSDHGVLPSKAMIQSGTFRIQNGSAVVSNMTEFTRLVPTKDRGTNLGGAVKAGTPDPGTEVQVIADDLVVQGSQCVGIDCTNAEAFGFDTVRLKENNLRIKFDDTSTAAGFPTHDWQLTANDSASGGRDQFSIEDVTASTVPFLVMGSAPTNSILIGMNGKVGFRTATPVLDLHMNTTDTPGVRLEQNSAGGFTAQTWDVAGNEANFFVRDVTGGSRLPFRIRPGAPTSSIDISSTGNVGIGTQTPQKNLHIGAVTKPTLRFEQMGGTAQVWDVSADDTTFSVSTDLGGRGIRTPFLLTKGAPNNSLFVGFTGSVGIGTPSPDQRLSVNGDASKVGGGSWQTFSDERLKNIKGRYTTGLKALMQLRPLRYEYKADNKLGLVSEGEYIGFGAQELEKIIPEAVTKNSEGYRMVNNDPIIWTMLNAIKEQQKEIEQLKQEVRKLQTTNKKLRK